MSAPDRPKCESFERQREGRPVSAQDPVAPQVVAVALNPALDQTIEVAGLQPGAVNRAVSMRVDVGGKAINVASCLADFGVRCAVTGLLGRDNAALFEELFRRKHIADHCHLIDGLTRTNTKVVDTATRETTDINMPGPAVNAVAAELLEHVLQRLDRLLESAKWVVLSGSLPPGMPADTYATITARVQAAGAGVVLDTSGAPLKAALAAGPHIVKPNRHELAELLAEPLDTLDALVDAGRRLLNGRDAPETVVVSLGEDGALFLTREQALHALPAKVKVASTVGAGDAMVAGLVAARLEERSLVEAAQLATAFSAGKLTRLGPHLPPPEEVRALAREIAVTALE